MFSLLYFLNVFKISAVSDGISANAIESKNIGRGMGATPNTLPTLGKNAIKISIIIDNTVVTITVGFLIALINDTIANKSSVT